MGGAVYRRELDAQCCALTRSKLWLGVRIAMDGSRYDAVNSLAKAV